MARRPGRLQKPKTRPGKEEAEFFPRLRRTRYSVAALNNVNFFYSFHRIHLVRTVGKINVYRPVFAKRLAFVAEAENHAARFFNWNGNVFTFRFEEAFDGGA